MPIHPFYSGTAYRYIIMLLHNRNQPHLQCFLPARFHIGIKNNPDRTGIRSIIAMRRDIIDHRESCSGRTIDNQMQLLTLFRQLHGMGIYLPGRGGCHHRPPAGLPAACTRSVTCKYCSLTSTTSRVAFFRSPPNRVVISRLAPNLASFVYVSRIGTSPFT